MFHCQHLTKTMIRFAWIFFLVSACAAADDFFDKYSNDEFGVRHFEKLKVADNGTTAEIFNDAARKIGHQVIYKILQQGDILHESKKALLEEKIVGLKLSCDDCVTAVSVLQILNSGKGKAIISQIAVEVCVLAKIEDGGVCKLAVNEFADELLFVFFHLKSNEACHWLQPDLCPKPAGYLPDWSIDVSPKAKPPLKHRQRPAAGSPTSKVLFFTDLHMDVQYQAGVDANCGEPLCCRDTNPPAKNASEAAGKWGDYRNCDMPPWTVEGMMKNLSNYHFDFILFTGDIPAHDVWNQSRSDQIDRNDRFTQLILKYFPGTPLYAALGNHASSPVNSYPPPQLANVPGGDIAWLYDGVSKNWKNWIPEKDLVTARKGGYYTTLIRKGLRVVTLNNNYCSDDSWWLLVGDYSVDPAGQLKWLVQVMQQAEDDGEKVIILSHRPTDGCLKSWSLNYYNIIMRYEGIIIAQFFGHAHTDELKLFYDMKNSSRLASVGFIGPGYTTYSNLNAGYRIYTFDGDYEGSTHSIMDGVSYYLDIEEANKSDKPVWRHEYSFLQDYGMKSMFPEDFEDLMNRFSNDLNLFQRYHQHVTKDKDTSYCDNTCRDNAIRGIKKTVAG